MWCSCGVWQDTLLPCRHACAVYRKSKSADKNYILANLIDEYYTFGCVQTTFTKNIYPVSLDTVAYDGETKPSLGNKRSSGRPRTKRIRRRSVYAASEDSPITCSNCGQAGHNKRTCSAKTKVKPMGIEQSADTIIEEATDELVRLQEEKDENEEEGNGTKDEQCTTEDNTESLSVP